MRPLCLGEGSKATVSIPASTSNFGSGFDVFGCAVELRNLFTLRILPRGSADEVMISGLNAMEIPTDSRNITLVAARRLFEEAVVGDAPLGLACELAIPASRGLGSSSSAIVGGLCAANAILDNLFSTDDLLRFAIDIEGHPDNVSPALLGGLVVSASGTEAPVYLRTAVSEDITFIFVIPDYRVSTAEARAVLPASITQADAVFNASRTPLLLHALREGATELLATALDDKLHHPYREHLFKGYANFHKAAMEAGAAGFCVSGAGPTMLAIATKDKREAVTNSLRQCLEQLHIPGDVRELSPTQHGALITHRS